MKTIWFSEEVLYLINIILLKVNFLCAREQEKARREHPLKLPTYPDKPTWGARPWLFYPEAIEQSLNANALTGQTSSDS